MTVLRIAVSAGLSIALLTASATRAFAAPNEHAERAARRSKLAIYHRSWAITTWISLAATNTIGTIRYANVIGFGEPLCAEGGSPILGRSWGCGDGLKIQHLVSASFTMGSYITTRTLAALMPDPGYERSWQLKLHRALSWVHLGGMIAMPILGFATSSSDDPHTREQLATAHLVVGYSTFATVTTSAALMVF